MTRTFWIDQKASAPHRFAHYPSVRLISEGRVGGFRAASYIFDFLKIPLIPLPLGERVKRLAAGSIVWLGVYGPMSGMVEEKNKPRRRKKEYICSCCGEKQPFCWTCPCGFQICNDCMEENLWGLTCSGVNWQCPDCGCLRPF